MWLLEQSIKQQIEEATLAGRVISDAEYQAMDHQGEGSILDPEVVEGVAVIHIQGILTEKPDAMARFFGGGNITYGDVSKALQAAEADSRVEKIKLSINSPGGDFAGLFPLLDVMGETTKPIHAMVGNLCASAAYAIASQAEHIEVATVASRIGSIGVVYITHVDPNAVTVASSKAPNKRPDPMTEAGRSVIRDELDEMHELFADAIASGRGTTVEAVNKDFGQGAVLLAKAALERGMIDAIVTKKPATSGPTKTEVKTMNLDELKAAHPETYKAAVEAGVTAERDRVEAHLTMGSASGDMKTALTAVTEGSHMTAALQATYMAAGMNKASTEARVEDGAAADAGDGAVVVDPTAATASADTAATAVADLIEAKLGLGQEA